MIIDLAYIYCTRLAISNGDASCGYRVGNVQTACQVIHSACRDNTQGALCADQPASNCVDGAITSCGDDQLYSGICGLFCQALPCFFQCCIKELWFDPVGTQPFQDSSFSLFWRHPFFRNC